jgi:hypothetical protein
MALILSWSVGVTDLGLADVVGDVSPRAISAFFRIFRTPIFGDQWLREVLGIFRVRCEC